MIFLTRGDISSLTEAVRDLPDGQYILPRFELPEPLWESFPRTDPQGILSLCRESGTKLHLDEVAISHPYMRFDSPGDFQLVPRQALFDINGFDERMIHGWHADSNMCKRFFLFYGRRTESLAHRLKGYHCDHTRGDPSPSPRSQAGKRPSGIRVWSRGSGCPSSGGILGCAGRTHRGAGFHGRPGSPVRVALERALGEPQVSEYYSDANDLRNFVYYTPEHALAYLAGNSRYTHAIRVLSMRVTTGGCSNWRRGASPKWGFSIRCSTCPNCLRAAQVPPARAIEEGWMREAVHCTLI